MAIKDYIPGKKSLIAGGVGAALGAGLMFSVASAGMFDREFVPSKETCSKYFESRNGRFMCLITGQKPSLAKASPSKEDTTVKKPEKKAAKPSKTIRRAPSVSPVREVPHVPLRKYRPW